MPKKAFIPFIIILLIFLFSVIHAFADYEELYGPVQEHQRFLQYLFDSELNPYGWDGIDTEKQTYKIPGSQENINFTEGVTMSFEDMIDSNRYKTFTVNIYKCVSNSEAKKALDGYINDYNDGNVSSTGRYERYNVSIGDNEAAHFKMIPSKGVDPDKVNLYDNVFWVRDEYLFLMMWLQNDLQQEHLEFAQKLTEITLDYGKTVAEDIKEKNDKRVTSPAASQQIPDIVLEANPSTQQPYKGIVADGQTRIEIIVKNTGGFEGKVSVKSLKYGSIAGKKTQKLTAGTKEVVFIYRPDEYLNSAELKTYIKDFKMGEAVEAFTATDTIEAVFTDAQNNITKKDKNISLFNPPVILVHGFTGGEGTWKLLDKYLTDKKFDTLRKEYYEFGNQKGGIETQAQKLSKDIQTLRDAYEHAGLKFGKIDIIGHSMGGLVARYYDKYHQRNVLRKLIMVGTPNHGVPRLDQLIGTFLANYLLKEHIRESGQLYCDNPVIVDLNMEENRGRHLTKGVQYAVIYGYGSLLGGDGIVNEYSAMLNGVECYGYSGMTHSPVLENIGLGPSLTGSAQVFDRVGDLLGRQILRTPLNDASMEVGFVTGNVKADDLTVHAGDDLRTGSTFRTEDGTARIILVSKGMVYGNIDVFKHTGFKVEFISPQEIELYVTDGEIRISIINRRKKGAAVSCLLTQDDRLQKITAKGTDYTIWTDVTGSGTCCMEGQVEVSYVSSLNNIETKILAEKMAVRINPSLDSLEYDRKTWWVENEFKRALPIFSVGIHFLDKWINAYLIWLKSATGIDSNLFITIIGGIAVLIAILIIIQLVLLISGSGRRKA